MATHTAQEIAARGEQLKRDNIVIRTYDIWKTYVMGDQVINAVSGVSIEIKRGEYVAIMGPSGSGKSTLMNLIGCLDSPSQGEYYINGSLVSQMDDDELATIRNKEIGFVFQTFNLLPRASALHNVELPLIYNGTPPKQRIEKAKQALREVDLVNRMDHKPNELSGGQRQRVAIGRAIVRDPKVFLFDEPLSNLDAALRVATRLEIAKLHHSMSNVTMIYVTHDQVEAMTLADRICVLRDGLIEQVGTPLELYERPQSLFVAGFIGSPQMNFLKGKFADAYKATTIGIRSEHIDIVESGGVWTGEVVHSENLGSDSYVYVEVGSEMPLIVRQNGTSSKKLGETLHLAPIGNTVHRFDAAGKPLSNG